MCRNTVPTLRVLQEWSRNEEGIPYPSTYVLQYQDKDGDWKNVPVVNRMPDPVQMELPFEDRPST
jgi:hypothetical protein